jgi:hypothetical protein
MAKYAVATRSIYGPGNRSRAAQMADRVQALYRSQTGFEHAHFFVFDDATTEVGSLVVFDSREHAEAAVGATRQQREDAGKQIGVQRQGTPEFRVVELYEAQG